jgi:hypothetical protein
MVQTTTDIERIVREVLADLGLSPPPALAATDDAAKAKDAESEQKPFDQPLPPVRPAGDVVVADRVVTLAGIGDRLVAARRLVVLPRAVVTPAVRDELRRRNVALVVEERTATAPGPRKIALTVLGSRIDATPLVDELQRLNMTVDLQRFDCLVRATDDMAGRLAAAGIAGVLLSNYGAIALCLANRHKGVRAVLASDESRTAGDAVSVGANMLVLEPRRVAPEAMRQIVTAFCRQGPGECPDELRERLA